MLYDWTSNEKARRVDVWEAMPAHNRVMAVVSYCIIS
jgi:hypothetical protein